MTRSTFVGSILGYVGGLGPHFCRGVPWSPDIVPYKTGEQPTTLNAQGDLHYTSLYTPLQDIQFHYATLSTTATATNTTAAYTTPHHTTLQ